MIKPRIYWVIAALMLAAISCQLFSGPASTPVPSPVPTRTTLPPKPVQSGETNPDEPVLITGEIPFTSPFFLNSISEPFVMLEDQAGFVRRDHDFKFSLASQDIGPVQQEGENLLTYSLALPSIPQGTMLDVDQDGEADTGVQIFAVAYWSNTWGDPFLEERDGTGWSTAYASTITDQDNDNEVVGGLLVVWAPDEEQSFPSGFGPDGLLFTEDDPTEPIPAGYNIVDLNSEPFQFDKQPTPNIRLNEGKVAVNDFSDLSYQEAFDAMFEKASREYPFTAEKDIDWQALYEQFAPRIAQANTDEEFYQALHDFKLAIPDAHVGISFNAEDFFQNSGGGFGMILVELSDGRVLVTRVIPGMPADREGIQPGAEITQWQGEDPGQAIDAVAPYLGPYSTPAHRRLEQIIFLTRVPPGESVTFSYKNPGSEQSKEVTLQSEPDYQSLFQAIPFLNKDQLVLPVEGQVLDESGLGYIRINTFSDDYRLMAGLWDHYMQLLIDNEIPGLIIDVRSNSGGSSGLAYDFAGYFFDQEITLYQGYYYNQRLKDFKVSGFPARVQPAPVQYEGPVAVLISPYCISACEGFTYAMHQEDRSITVGHFPTAGAFGEVGRGQYQLPGDVSMQFPTGRPETAEGKLLIEGAGVQPDITVPVTEEGALGGSDTVLQAAVDALLDRIP